ncbi:unnamed protein product [Alternaria alternata]
MAHTVQPHASQTLREFLHLLKQQWTLSVACQNQCDPPEQCSCLRYIVHVEDLKRWWKRTVSESTGQTKLQRLLDELEPAEHQLFPVEQKLFSGEYTCLTVFSLLLTQGRHHLIERFHNSGIDDRDLEKITPNSEATLRNSLAIVPSHDDVEKIIGDFQRERWAYCPLKLELHMDRYLQFTRVIPPFCRKVILGDKGGTASIYWVTVQKDLLSDDSLKNALQDSLYQDKEFGECYQMVLKSYTGKYRTAYDLEKQAFLGLKHKETVPIVRYLGCYTHQYGEGSDAGTTYNLLLEWGQRDLYEAWEDEKNVPPVRAREIIRTWESIFEVADAIRHIHNLEVQRGKEKPSLKFNGWHADIKPDNILLVRGRAPEVSMKQSNGTLSSVTQSIDIWSFGCVLSVAATWIALGFQGVRQYEVLRKLSPANKVNGQIYDRFHNGYDVLPEIKQWHDFLRGHLRPSDTATPLVLDLIELKMLQQEPLRRIDTSRLCQELKHLLRSAEDRINDLEHNSKDTDAIVLRALLEVEQTAEFQRSSEQTTNPLQQRLNATTDAPPIDPRPRSSIQTQKEERRKSRRLGLTPYRREILQSELADRSYVISEEANSSTKEYHRGDTTESPIQENFPESQYPTSGILKESFPSAGAIGIHTKSDHGQDTIPSLTLSVPTAEDNGVLQLPVKAHHDFGPRGEGHEEGLDANHAGSSDAISDRTQTFRSTDQKYETNLKPLHSATDPSSSSKHKELVMEDTSGPSSEPASLSHSGALSNSITLSAEFTRFRGPQNESDGIGHFKHVGHQVETRGDLPSHRSRDAEVLHNSVHSQQPGTSVYNPPNHAGSVHEMPVVRSPDPGLPHRLDSSATSPLTDGVLQGLRIVSEAAPFDREQDRNSAITNFEDVPSEVFDLPYDVCQQRKLLEMGTPKGIRAKVKSKFGWEDRKPDSNLAPTFSVSRDLVLIIDNGATMFQHWPIAMFVAETLAMKAAGLDRDGIDVYFTVDGDAHNLKALVGDGGRQRLRKALLNAAPDNIDHKDSQTNMLEVLFRIAENWRTKGKSATTLLVLTDGLWKKTNNDVFDDAIIDLAQDAAQAANLRTGNRPFSFQFIRFGDEGYERLRYLDDQLCKERNRGRDIIDHCSWRTSVYKMFKGSIDGFHDQSDADEQDMKYYYPALVALFKAYNESNHLQERSTGFLSPTSPTQSPLARTFSRSSNSLNWEKHRSVPETSPQRRSSHRKMFSQ